MSRHILRLPAVIAATGHSKSTIRRLEVAGRFPRRVKISDNAVGWYSDEIEAHLGTLPRQRLIGAKDELGVGAGP